MTDIHDVERLMRLAATVPHRDKCSNIQVRVPYREIQRFKEILPMKGSVSWFVRAMIEDFNDQAGTITDESHIIVVRERVAKLAKRPRVRSTRG